MNIPSVKVPKYTGKLPVSEVEFEYRPFLVKEEKILIMANDSGEEEAIVNAMSDIIESCTFNKVKMEDYCLADLQYAFMQIRGKSIGEEISFYAICGECKHKHIKTIHIDEFEVSNLENKNNNIIDLGGGLKAELKYPLLKHYIKLFSDDSTEGIFSVISECIVKIFDDEEVFEAKQDNLNEVREFLENLTTAQFEKFEEFFVGMPILFKQIDFTCSNCNTENSTVVNSISNFFD